MGTTRFATCALLLSLLGPCSCGGQTAAAGHSSSAGNAGTPAERMGGAGGQVSSGTGGAAGVLVVATAGASANCPVEGKTSGQPLSKDCQVATRIVEPTATCGTTCAITKALDLTCALLPEKPSLSATLDGALLLATTVDHDQVEAVARLMTVKAASSRVEDIPALAAANSMDTYYSRQNAVVSSDASGATWLFGGQAPGINAVHGTDGGWAMIAVLPSPDPEYGIVLTDARMVDNRLGYLTYATWFSDAQHLVVWDGSCWMDQEIGETSGRSLVVETDKQQRPWVAWISSASSGETVVYLRSPTGEVQNLVEGSTPTYNSPLRLLPGGFGSGGTSAALAAQFDDGIRVYYQDAATGAGWRSFTLPSSAPQGGTSDCPSLPPSYDTVDHCAGMTTCTMSAQRKVSGFDLVRTQSGAVFVAWVVYSSEGTYALREVPTDGGEMPRYTCGMTETSGSGTADLVVARITDSEPILTHHYFDLGGAAMARFREFAMAARGDTLVVSAYLRGDTIPVLTYLELDSKLLP